MSKHTSNSTSHPIQPPRLDPLAEDLLLDEYLTTRLTYFALAKKHNLTVDQLLAWFRQDRIQQRLIAIERDADSRARIAAKLHASAAIEHLAHVMNDPGIHPNERRKAASAILRASHRKEPRPSQTPTTSTPPAGNEPAPGPQAAHSSPHHSTSLPRPHRARGDTAPRPRAAAAHETRPRNNRQVLSPPDARK